MPLPPALRCSSWCLEMMFPIIGSVQMYTSVFIIAIFGELMIYHDVIVMPILLCVSGFLGNVVGFTVNYRRFYEIKQSGRLMTYVAFITVSNACICYYYLFFYVTKEMRLSNMREYYNNQCVKKMIDLTQQTMECCGDFEYKDWFRVDWMGSAIEPGKSFPSNGIQTRGAVPFSCCSVEEPSPCTNLYVNLDNGTGLYQQGCRKALTNAFTIFTIVEATVLLFTGLLQMYWLLWFLPSELPTADIEKGPVGKGEDKKRKKQSKVKLDIEVEIDVEEDTNTDCSQNATLLAVSRVPGLPPIPMTKYPIPERYSCESLIENENCNLSDPSAKGDKVQDTDIDAEFDTLRSQEDPCEGPSTQKDPYYSTEESAAERLHREALNSKDDRGCEENDEENLSCYFPDEGTGDTTSETPQPSAESGDEAMKRSEKPQ